MKVQKSNLTKLGKKLSKEQLLNELKKKNVKGGLKGCPPPGEYG